MAKIEPSSDQDRRVPPTEAALAAAQPLDALSSLEAVRRMNRAEADLHAVLAGEEAKLAQAIELAVQAFRSGGRLIYVGAGTSGRLGVLDAAECPPTFGVSPRRVIGLIAGGEAALRESIEGAEDDERAGKRDLQALDPPPGPCDVVVGITASGTTPYVLAALDAAAASKAKTVLLCCNPAQRHAAPLVIALDTGAEVLPGSTRLKAGTAVKMALNRISTGAMAAWGRVFEGWMVGMRPVNRKLHGRAVRIVERLTGYAENEAGELLQAADQRISVAVLMARKTVTAEEAALRLERCAGSLRAALNERNNG